MHGWCRLTGGSSILAEGDKAGLKVVSSSSMVCMLLCKGRLQVQTVTEEEKVIHDIIDVHVQCMGH